MADGGVSTINACWKSDTCGRNADCNCNGLPRVCQVYINEAGNGLVTLCAVPDPGGAQIGATCDPNANPDQCENNLCSYRGYCMGVCQNAAQDCQAIDPSLNCSAVSFNLPDGGVDSVDLCVKAAPVCTRDRDCTSSDTCQLDVQSADGGYTFSLRCYPPPGAQNSGQTCSDDNTCRSALCLNAGYCSQICQTSSDCDDNSMDCSTINLVDAGDNILYSFKGCVEASTQWTCSLSYYGTGDGCDCGCSITDPDCNGSGCTTPGCSHSDCDFEW